MLKLLIGRDPPWGDPGCPPPDGKTGCVVFFVLIIGGMFGGMIGIEKILLQFV